ncbi:MAG: 1-deoxy-D-xylulose-5-phosphate synthase [Bacteroidia bacterium]|nr:MAG: 1-deoxy-D-xylulose-5-phosphate synthase [Bacteroidia bacterium]
MMNFKYLDKINLPDDLKQLKEEELIHVSSELRQFIIDVISEIPGHFASSLGVVELTVALHYVFDMPYDKIVWDVGHQAYGHKILTGRKDIFHTIRQKGGLSGFPSPFESPYDAFGVGHSSTSISAALGMAIASCYKEEDDDRHIVAVIGDGAMTGGMAFEAMNNAGVLKSNLLIILNDNRMSIDPNVGGLNQYLLDITTSGAYNKIKNDVWNILGKIKKPGINTREFIAKIENGVKSVFMKYGNIFEAMNLRYFGPVNGHDVNQLAKTLKDLKTIKGPKLLHVLTKKGKGFQFAEENQTTWHAPGIFNKETGERIKSNTDAMPPKFQDVFGNTLVELAEKNDKIMGITPAMPSGSSMKIMMEAMPHRAFDVGIAEQHAVTFSAGLAAAGLVPFCNIYSSFMQRAFDQVIHDVALQKLPVVFCLDRGGLVGEDGATHHGAFDLAYMRMIPDMIVAAPMDEVELRNMMYTAQAENHGAFSIRYPRGRGVKINWKTPMQAIEIGKGRQISQGTQVAILSIGTVGNTVVEAIESLGDEHITPAHYDMRFVKPLDKELIKSVLERFEKIITVEDGVLSGGFGSAVLECINENGAQIQLKRLGIPDEFITHGTQQELRAMCGYDKEGIVKTIKEMSPIS